MIWMKTLWMSVVLAAVLASGTVSGGVVSPATPAGTEETVVDLQAATDWLIAQQDETGGGFPGFSGEPEVGITIDALIALVSAQLRGIDVGSAIDDAVAYLESGDAASGYAQTGVGQAAKLVMGIVAYGGDPHDIAEADPLSLVEEGLSADTGFYGSGVYDHAHALLALGAAGSDVPAEAITTLEETQTAGGGWAFDGATAAGPADSNTTAMVIMGLVATGYGDSLLIDDALAYLQATRVDDTGATFQPGDAAVAGANWTALVIQAVIAAGEDPESEIWGDLLAALGGFQKESGAFFYNETDTSGNLFSTAQAIPAAAGFTLPVVPETDIRATPVARVGAREVAWGA